MFNYFCNFILPQYNFLFHVQRTYGAHYSDESSSMVEEQCQEIEQEHRTDTIIYLLSDNNNFIVPQAINRLLSDNKFV
jgi:hypothetical protein